MCKTCDKMVDKNSADLSIVYAEEILNSLLLLLHDDQLFEDILDVLANTISNIIQASPKLKLSLPSSINNLTNAIACSLQRKEFNAIRTKAILNLSCLLMKNHSKVPWLDDMLLIATTNELEILKEKTILLSDLVNNITYTNPQSEMMDVDQSSVA